jgi:Type II intron maturase
MLSQSFPKPRFCLVPHPCLRSFSSLCSKPQPTSLDPDQNPYDLLKSDPIEILSGLWVRAFSRPTPRLVPFPNVTGYLKSFDLWVLAYQRSCAYHTGTFPPRAAVHYSHLRSLLSLRHTVLSSPSTFPWGASSHHLLRSPAEKPSTTLIGKRKFEQLLETAPPPFQDRVIQELLLLILEPVLETCFSSKSHAYRHGRGPHTVIRTIRSNFAGYLWFLKADLTNISVHLDPNTIIGYLEQVISDRSVIRLVKSGLKRTVRPGSIEKEREEPDGFAKKRLKRKILHSSRKKKVLDENEPKPDPYWLRVFFGFAPEEAKTVPVYGHCGIISPLLLNVCYSELDFWMEDKIEKYFEPSKSGSICREKINEGCHNPAWPEFVPANGAYKTRKMDYIRYGSHILIGIHGPREDAVQIQKDLIEFCETKFGLRLENSKIEIGHISRGIEFLDHIISRRVIYPTLRYTGTGGKVVSEKGLGTMLSVTASLQHCITHFRKLQLVKGDRDPEPLPCTPMLYSGQAHTNSQMNKFLEAMADWYRYADNRKKIIGFCAYVIRSSLAKLYAARYRLKSRAKVYRIGSRDLSRPLKEATKNAAPEYSDLLRMGLVDVIEGVQFAHMSSIPSCDYTPLPRSWVPYHELVLREYVKLQDPQFFCHLYKEAKRGELESPQDFVAEVVWDYKVNGVWNKKLQERW